MNGQVGGTFPDRARKERPSGQHFELLLQRGVGVRRLEDPEIGYNA